MFGIIKYVMGNGGNPFNISFENNFHRNIKTFIIYTFKSQEEHL